MSSNFIKDNQDSWDLRTSVHLDSEFYNVAAFLNGNSTLSPIEINLLGEVVGKKLLHLQCHFGLDTLSWARLGAIATGVDFSPAAISAARALSERSGTIANFIQSDVQQLGVLVQHGFDIVYSSYGVICWLSDLEQWAKSIHDNLLPGGRFILIEFHPILDLLFHGKISGCPSYFGDSLPLSEKSTGTYTDPDAPISYLEHRWQHPISEVLQSLLSSGLILQCINEYPCSPYKVSEKLDTFEDGVWKSSSDKEKIPYLYSIVMLKNSL